MNYRRMIEGLRAFKVTDWGKDSGEMAAGNDREQAAEVREADVVSSLVENSVGRLAGPRHKLVLDIDHPALLLDSSTDGHHHLYIDVEIPEVQYWTLLDALADAGIIEPSYASVSKARGHTDVRLPWVSKPASAAAPR